MTPAAILSWRLARGLTQAQAAALVGKTAQRWSEWERARNPIPMPETVRRLIVALDRIYELEMRHQKRDGVGVAVAAASDRGYGRMVSHVDSDGTA